MKRPLALLLACGLILQACSAATDDTIPTTSTTVPVQTDQSTGQRLIEPFATFAAIPLLDDATPYAGPPTPDSLTGVLWADRVPDNARGLLETNGFVVYESGIGQFHEAYSHVDQYGRQPLFVTVDSAYHYWHLAFSKVLRDTEQQVLLPMLEDFARSLSARAADAVGGSEEEIDRIGDLASLLEALLEISEPPTGPIADEVALITDHVAVANSPILGLEVDYSLFGARGHYTRTPELGRYFRAMSVLGQYGFRVAEPAQLRTGLLLADLIASDEHLTETWSGIYEPTAFLVGLADDFTPLEVVAAADSVDPEWRTGAIDDDFLADVARHLAESRAVAIDPERASMRIMGARFVLDSYILDQLVSPNVTDSAGVGRLRASVLDVAAAFGSEWAYDIQRQAGVPAEYPDYESQMSSVRTIVTARNASDWAGTVYDAWLYAIAPMWSPHGLAYPDFMRTDAWAAKAHTTGFGSYAELKHDTLLYAKQAFAEGEGPPVPAEPRHWVEPEPVVYERLAAVASLIREGFASRDLLTDDAAELLDRLDSMYRRLAELAREELAGEPITAEDNEWIETISSRFELIWLLAAADDDASDAQTGGSSAGSDEIAAVVADIMSNPEDAMQVGTGHIDLIYVLVPNDEGQFQVARGAVYSFYEFWVPRGERLTDEEWRIMLADGQAPDRPAWITESFTGWDR
jgi:hypothetical protein